MGSHVLIESSLLIEKLIPEEKKKNKKKKGVKKIKIIVMSIYYYGFGVKPLAPLFHLESKLINNLKTFWRIYKKIKILFADYRCQNSD